jgi:hypothetical protein
LATGGSPSTQAAAKMRQSPGTLGQIQDVATGQENGFDYLSLDVILPLLVDKK